MRRVAIVCWLLPGLAHADDRGELPVQAHVVGGLEVGLASETTSVGFRGMLVGAKTMGTSDRARPVAGGGLELGGGGVYPNSELAWTGYWSAGPVVVVGLQMMDDNRRATLLFATAAYLRTGTGSHGGAGMPAVVGSNGWRASIGANFWQIGKTLLRRDPDSMMFLVPSHLELAVEDDVGSRRVGAVFGYGF